MVKALTLPALCLTLLLRATGASHAIGSERNPVESGGSSVMRRSGTHYQAGVKAIDEEDWPTAIGHFEKATAQDPRNADAWNYLAFSNRKLGNLDKAFAYYRKALEINPKHLGANEYLGEAYLQAGNLPKAQAQLARLEQLCGKQCEEYQDLKEDIAEYQAKRRP